MPQKPRKFDGANRHTRGECHTVSSPPESVVSTFMASISKNVKLAAKPDEVWDALADFGNLHERLVPGFVTNATLEGSTRTITFANGASTKETLVTSDAENKRLVYCARSERVEHYNAVAQVLEDGAGSRFEWTIDLLPDAIAPYVASQMDLGLAAITEKFGAR